jgi:hypothetical protein
MPICLWKSIWCQSVQAFRRIICIDIVNIGSLPFWGLMDHFVITGKGVDCPRELGKNAMVDLIHSFMVCSEDCTFCEEVWWLWLRIGDTWVSRIDKILQSFLSSPSTNLHIIRKWHHILYTTMLLIGPLTNR